MVFEIRIRLQVRLLSEPVVVFLSASNFSTLRSDKCPNLGIAKRYGIGLSKDHPNKEISARN